jgi:ABC-2 type transport system permease protein
MTSAERGALSARVAKYAAFARFGYATARAEPAELYARVLFFFMILGVFSSLWRAVAATGARVGGDANTLVWYLAVTEWILLSAPAIQFRIEDDVRRGDVAYQVTRPASYLGGQVALSLGALAARSPVLLVSACVAGWTFGGHATPKLIPMLFAVGFGAIGSIVVTTFNVALGLTAFWLGDIAPAYWIWQKLIFVLGGLLLPLPLYPDLVVRIARFTPFPALLTGPASFLLERPFFDGPTLVIALVGWSLAAATLASFLYRRATRDLQVNGG